MSGGAREEPGLGADQSKGSGDGLEDGKLIDGRFDEAASELGY